jgi:HEPN domain-containing protein
MNEHKEQAETLFAAGARDRIALRVLRESGEAPHESMGFHAQQAAEKFIKAALVIHGVVFERTHDLAGLASLCGAHGIHIPLSADTLRPLNIYAVRFRYEACPAGGIDLAEAAAHVEILHQWAREQIDQAA